MAASGYEFRNLDSCSLEIADTPSSASFRMQATGRVSSSDLSDEAPSDDSAASVRDENWRNVARWLVSCNERGAAAESYPPIGDVPQSSTNLTPAPCFAAEAKKYRPGIPNKRISRPSAQANVAGKKNYSLDANIVQPTAESIVKP